MKPNFRLLMTLGIFASLSIFINCGSDESDPAINISVTTTNASNITFSSAQIGGFIDGEGAIAAGVVVSTSGTPTVETGTSTSSFTTTGSFTVTVTGLTQLTTYFARAYAVTEDGIAYGATVSFSTEIQDSTAPTLISVSPSGTNTPLPVDGEIVLTFSEPMDLTSFRTPSQSSDNNIYLSGGLYGGDVPFTLSADGNTIIITPNQDLDGGELLYSYGLFADDITDLAGNGLATDFGSESGSFVTENTALTITSISPAADETNVALDASIVVTFSQTLDPNFVNTGAFTLSSVSGSTSGSVVVSGNTVTFTPSAELNDFMTSYNFYVEGYGSLQIRDINGNYFPDQESISFRTEAFSTNYYYEFDGNYGYANDNLDITYNGGTSYTINVSSGSGYESMQWRVVKTTYGGEDVYAFTNKVIDNNGQERFIEAAAPDDGNKILISGRPSTTTWYTGQLWKVEPSNNNSNGFLLKAVVPNAYLSSIDLDINVNIGSGIPYEHEWLVTRRSAY
ncbi:Ig-like domain-containing protein [Ekhidna sp. To15]|uniref:Ig-like domain-containing protein n=1 Tax=Ekhidna sp. To15 TaxID=3395267 RepID=UPI003F52151C